jgi:LAS superfamily LD-carboxypeptidase LdcB
VTPKSRPPQPSNSGNSGKRSILIVSESATNRFSRRLNRLFPQWLRWGCAWVLSLGVLAAILTYRPVPESVAQLVVQPVAERSVDRIRSVFPSVMHFLATSQPLLVPSPHPSQLPPPLPKSQPVQTASRLGHLAYTEAKPTQLMIIGSYAEDLMQRFERMDLAAGLALMQMIDAARLDGVWLVPVSGFRDHDRQQLLFQDEIARRGSEAAAAKTVAPPGYSEHHTGYAIDLANGIAESGDLTIAFEQTEAFAWLTRHAQTFNFELSFPSGNPQGINYEPWHWRYIGSPQATKTFQRAEAIKTQTSVSSLPH